NVAAPPALQQVILRALARDPNARFASAGDMRMELRRAAAALAMEGTAAVAVLVDSSATQFATSLSGATLDTLGAVTRKGSGANMTVTAIIASVGVIALVALVFIPATTDIGILLAVGLAIGGAAWWMFRRRRAGAQAPEPDADLFGRASEGMGLPTGAGTAFRIRGPREDRVVRAVMPCIIGRSSDAQLCVDDDLASRRHAMLECRADRIWVIDLASRNGTFLDGVPVGDGAPLLPGSVVTVGSTEISVAS
ncbi:MAG TPA: FHA domain-containing protein, partial [Coriobacteriia bacterium]